MKQWHLFLSLLYEYFQKHSLNNYQPMANLKQWDSYENLYLGLLGMTLSQKRQGLIQLGLARPLSLEVHTHAIYTRFTPGFCEGSYSRLHERQVYSAGRPRPQMLSDLPAHIPGCRRMCQGSSLQLASSSHWGPGLGDVTELQD